MTYLDETSADSAASAEQAAAQTQAAADDTAGGGTGGGGTGGRKGRSPWLGVAHALKFLYPLVVCCVLWEIVARLHHDSLTLPSFSSTATSLYHGLITGTSMWPDVAITLERAGIGFAIAAVLGVAVGLAMSANKAVSSFLDPLISVTFPTPKLALFPILLVWFGVGDSTKIILVAFGSIFPVIVNTYTASAGINRYLLWNARSKGAGRLQTILHVVLPASMPQIFAGIRIASSLAFLLAVSSEIISSTSGLGYLIMSSEQAFEPQTTIAAIVLTGILGLLLDRIVFLLQHYTSRWQERG